MIKTSDITPEDIQKNKELAALSYLWVFSLVIGLSRKESAYIQWHARQGMVLFGLSWIVWFLPLGQYLELGLLALMVMGFLQAATGNVYRLPVIGDLSEGRLSLDSLFKRKVQKEEAGAMADRHLVHAEERVTELEEKKLSAMIHRLDEDEKALQELREKVENLENRSTPAA